jgi:heme/copper-type cytochrome/quinol oxidase subunit 3
VDAVAQARRLTEDTAVAAPRASSNGWWGMMTLIATEAMLFATLIASYFYLRWQAEGGWPPDGLKDPKLLRPAIMTAILVSSSLPMYLGEEGIRRNRPGRLVAGLTGTLLLGGVFLGFQAWEYVEKVKEYTPQTNAYGSLFYTITGFHGAHVAIGLLLIAWTLWRALRGRFSARRHLGVQATAVYWHFVDVMWVVAIFPSLYITPHF